MARRDERNRNNRKKVTSTSTKNRTRIVKGDSEVKKYTGLYRAGQSVTSIYEDTGQTAWEAGHTNPKDSIAARNNLSGKDDTNAGWSSSKGEVVKWENDLASRDSDVYGRGYDGTASVWIKSQEPDKRINETVSTKSARYQALDKKSGDDDSQKQRNLKTKKEGRNKLRIKLAGDGSTGRLRGGPNSDRKRNKLKIDVQSAGGNTGINVPR